MVKNMNFLLPCNQRYDPSCAFQSSLGDNRQQYGCGNGDSVSRINTYESLRGKDGGYGTSTFLG